MSFNLAPSSTPFRSTHRVSDTKSLNFAQITCRSNPATLVKHFRRKRAYGCATAASPPQTILTVRHGLPTARCTVQRRYSRGRWMCPLSWLMFFVGGAFGRPIHALHRRCKGLTLVAHRISEHRALDSIRIPTGIAPNTPSPSFEFSACQLQYNQVVIFVLDSLAPSF
jgi:hypothetical protein